MIVTPTVVQEVRDYFNCSELEGAELEDQGEEGTVLTHWEKRVFEVVLFIILALFCIAEVSLKVKLERTVLVT